MSIQIKRGMKKDLPQLKDGELAFCKDTKELYVGSNGNENVNVTDKSSEIINEFNSKINGIESTLSSNVEQTGANKEYIESKKSAIQKAIDFVDSFKCEFDFSSGDSCYIKLPDVFGGLIIQFGAFRCNAISDFGNEQYTEKFYDKQISLPKRFPNRVLYVNSNITGLVKSGVRKLTYHEFFDTKCSPHYNDARGKIDVSVWRRACNRDLTGYEVIVDYLVIGR